MDEDFNTPQAIAVLSEVVRWTNSYLDEPPQSPAVLSRLNDTFNVLGGDVLGIVTDTLIGEEPEGGLESRLVELLIRMRAEARGRKDFETADGIRERLREIGVELMDTAEGTTWKRA